MATFTKLPSGKVRAQVRIGGFYRAQTFDLEKNARKWAKEIEQQLKLSTNGDYIDPPKNANFEDLVSVYEEHVGGVKAFGKNKKAVLKSLKAKIGHVKLRALSEAVVRDFVDRRVKEGAGGVTIAVDLAYLRAVLSWARYVRNLNLDPDITLDVRRSLARRGLKVRSNERTRVASPSELSKLCEHYQKMKRNTIDMIAVIEFALLTSLRQEEICMLRIEDIDLERRVMLVRDRKHPTEKMGNHGEVPVLDDFVEPINKAINGRETGRLFPYAPRSVSASFTRACKATGIEDLRFHDLRHTAATDLFTRELDIESVSLFTGHKDWKMLRRYTHIKAESVHLIERRKALRRAGEDVSQSGSDVTTV
ncbi:site-specific integrase [Pseudomonas sp. LH1G9]|uniref:tyrosine-type recombinase/integrase n=1 Tax=Pseudomonas sp. LH1G9 TaxID=2083055 RepID=UPI000CF35A46|nr:site-specific integrase [Pseudomonas sp. LH1G9]